MWPRLLVFDVDGTLVSEKTDKVFDNAVQVLNDNKVGFARLAIASFRYHVEEILRTNNILHYFDYIESPPVFNAYSKSAMLHKLAVMCNIDESDMIFFDNLKVNCDECTLHGICAQLVDTNVGVTKNDLERAVARWREGIGKVWFK